MRALAFAPLVIGCRASASIVWRGPAATKWRIRSGVGTMARAVGTIAPAERDIWPGMRATSHANAPESTAFDD
jgi:hypothetical protein